MEPSVLFVVALLAFSFVLAAFSRVFRAKIVAGAKLSWAYVKILLAAALVFVAALIVNRLSEKSEGVSILSFDNETGDTKYNGDAIASSLKIELLRIQEILSTAHKGIGSEGSERMRATPITESGEKLNESLKEIGTVELGEAKLAIGPLLLAAKRLWPFGDPGIVISGSIQKFGKQMRLVAFLEYRHQIQGFEVADDIQSDEKLPDLVRKMAFKMAKSLGDPKQPIFAKTVEGFQNFTEALNCYDRFFISGDIGQLQHAREFCNQAIAAEQNYNKMVPLLKNLGVYFYKRSAFKESGELFEQVTTLQPGDSEAWNNLGLALAETKQLGAAQRAFDEARTLLGEKGSVDYHLNMGRAFSIMNRYPDAEREFGEAIKLNSQSVQGHLGLGNCLLIEGNNAGAQQEYGIALTYDPNSVEANMHVADMDFQAGRYDAALSKYNQALKIDRYSAPAMSAIGDLYEASGEFDLAFGYYDRAARVAPQYFYAHVGLGSCLAEKGDYEGSAKELREAAELDPRNPEPHLWLGRSLSSRSEFDAAIKEYRRAIELRPELADPRLAIAEVFRTEGKYSDAEGACKEVLDLWKGNPSAHCCLGRIRLDQGRIDDAIGEFQNAINLAPSFSDGYVGKGEAFEREAKYPDALSQYDLALNLRPNDYDAHCGKADTLVAIGKFVEAAAEYDRASHILPGAWRAYIGLGDVDSAQGRYERAQAEYEQARKIAPDGSTVNVRLGDIAKRTGNYDLAGAKYDAASKSTLLSGYAWTELAWLNLRIRAFAKAQTYLDKVWAIDERNSSAGLAAGAVLYLQGHARDAARVWKVRLGNCRFDGIRATLDRIILLYVLSGPEQAREALQNLASESKELPGEALTDSLYYVGILSIVDPHRFLSLRDMLSNAGRSFDASGQSKPATSGQN